MTKDTQNHTPQNGNTADVHGNTADVHTTEDTPQPRTLGEVMENLEVYTRELIEDLFKTKTMTNKTTHKSVEEQVEEVRREELEHWEEKFDEGWASDNPDHPRIAKRESVKRFIGNLLTTLQRDRDMAWFDAIDNTLGSEAALQVQKEIKENYD